MYLEQGWGETWTSREQDVSSGSAGLLGQHLGEAGSALGVRGARPDPEVQGIKRLLSDSQKSRSSGKHLGRSMGLVSFCLEEQPCHLSWLLPGWLRLQR